MTEFRHSFRIYYEDTDAGGIVYYANYLKFAERGRSEALREMGFDNISLLNEHGIVIVVRKVDIDYLASARLDEMLNVMSEVSEIKGSSFWMHQTMETRDSLCASAKILLVCVDIETGRPVKIPHDLKEMLAQNRMVLH